MEPQRPTFRWDGSIQDNGFPRRNLKIWNSSSSRTLRSDAVATCRYCGNRMEYFDRFDGGRIPMVPKELPSRQIPARFRWSVFNGTAYRGDGGMRWCWLPHPTACPGVEHTDSDRELDSLRRALALHMRKLISEGQFTPPAHPAADEHDVAEQHVVTTSNTRHIVRLTGTTLWLAPCALKDIRCVAHVQRTGQRCQNELFNPDSKEGNWQQVDIPAEPGRAGQAVLWEGHTMWAWVVTVLDFPAMQRWAKQRCRFHWEDSTAHNAVPDEWIHFHPVRHTDFILRKRPTDPVYGDPNQESLLSLTAPGPNHTNCANAGCGNGSDAPVPEGWICSTCHTRALRREAVHRKWQNPTT